MTETLASFLPGRAKDLSVFLYFLFVNDWPRNSLSVFGPKTLHLYDWHSDDQVRLG